MGKNKKTKRQTWRKAKIQDVEEAVEDERLVSRLKRQSGPTSKRSKVAAQDDGDELFTVDTAGSCEGLSKKTRRELARAKLFPPKAPKLGLSGSEEAKVSRMAKSLGQRKPVSRERDVFDLWGEPLPESSSVKPPLSAEFTAIRRAQSLPSSAPNTLHQKVSKAPAVVPAHEGQSMNPAPKAYEDLVCTAAARELERERENEELDRKLRPMTHELLDVAGPEALQGMNEEAKVELYRSIACSKKPQAEGEGAAETSSKLGARRKEQKSQSFRNKEKKLKKLHEEERRRRAQRSLEKSVGEVGAILRDIKDQTGQQQERQQYLETLRSEKRRLEESQGIVPKRRKLGRNEFTEETIVVPDAEAAAKGLRAVPLKGGTAIHDRICSIVRRGLLPATPAASKADIVRRTRKAGRLKRSRKFVSPLLRETIT
jgi:hypothetical protein